MRGLYYATFLVWTLTAGFCYAIEVTPMVVAFSPTGSSNTATSLVYNSLPRDIAFDILVNEIQFSEQDPKQEPQLVAQAEPPLWVFPPSLYLKPGQAQRLQFKWLADAIPSTDKSYQVSLVEQPINTPLINNSSKLSVLLNVNLIVHVDQPKLTPSLKVGELYLEGANIMASIRNTGAGASRLSDYKIKLINTSTGVLLQRILQQQLKALGYDVFFAPNSVQQIKIPIPKTITGGSLKNLRLELVR
ncbi:hypothetical protein [Pseudoalteromonas sp.]|uniref:hypothetical protein n=1 Tax=Pseudoalteromonas sp. TaxID=53249 RepID=UPI0035686258